MSRIRARWWDVTCIALTLALGALLLRFGDAMADPAPLLPWQVHAVLGTLCCVGLWWRHRWPLGLAWACVPAGAISGMAAAPITVAVFAVAVHHRARTALTVAVANLATVPVFFLLQANPRFPIWVDFVLRGAFLAAAVGWGSAVRAQRQLVGSLRERAAQLEAEQHLRVDQARLTERTRIAREMHDVLAHRLSLLSLHAGALEIRTDARPEEVSAAAGVIRASTHEALEELRSVIGVLREEPSGVTGAERPQPGLADLPELIETARAAGTKVDFACPIEKVPATLGRTVYRLVQEGLTNVRKHAPHTAARVRVAGTPAEGLRALVTNPLPLTPPSTGVPGAGMGLVGLRERFALAGGRLEYGPDEDGCFTLEGWLPWPKTDP
ncbi:sensor histidine kinase [Cryptosporangium aurantiacum]|uniref:histidine kinase n=1 Tax=Cryptosporangium aurantiacum TaxID=134849 RepID=A0A1M7RDT1_9ACTN|nr:histidine kinase [Cryptosporangium aurantiacum]SHN44322.1 Signal transduction histidine kinase [Cryptosporangium aurantiacum]